MSNKSKLTQDERDAIKKAFDINNPPPDVEGRKYWNKIKAGKARSASAYRNDKGVIILFPQRYLDEVITPIAARNNKSVREFLQFKSNRDEMRELLKTESLDWHYNNDTVQKIFAQYPQGTNYYIDNGRETKHYNIIDLKHYLTRLRQEFTHNGVKFYYYRVRITQSFTKFVFQLPMIGAITYANKMKRSGFIKVVLSEEKKKVIRATFDANKPPTNELEFNYWNALKQHIKDKKNGKK